MEYRPLGRTDLKVSAICLGTMTFGEQNTEAEGHAQMDLALESGVNFFDTAELYSIPPKPETQGSTERIIGTWFAQRRNRDKVILATKAIGRTGMNWFRADGSPGRVTKAQLTEALDGSLTRLRTDYIDLYQLHFPERPMAWGSNPTRFDPAAHAPVADETPIDEQLEALDGFVKAGKVRHIGLSNESAWGTMRFLFASEAKGLPRVQSIQNAYNLVNRTYETALAEVTLREQVGLLAYSPLGQGYLTGKYRKGAMPAGTRKTLFDRLQRYETPGAHEAYEDYFALADAFGLDATQMALQFVTTRPFVTSNIIGATSQEQLRLNLDSVHVPMTDEMVAQIDAIHQVRGNPCP